MLYYLFLKIIIIRLPHFICGIQLHWHWPQLTELLGDYATVPFQDPKMLHPVYLVPSQPPPGESPHWSQSKRLGKVTISFLPSRERVELGDIHKSNSHCIKGRLSPEQVTRLTDLALLTLVCNLTLHSLPFSDVHFLRQRSKWILWW